MPYRGQVWVGQRQAVRAVICGRAGANPFALFGGLVRVPFQRSRLPTGTLRWSVATGSPGVGRERSMPLTVSGRKAVEDWKRKVMAFFMCFVNEMRFFFVSEKIIFIESFANHTSRYRSHILHLFQIESPKAITSCNSKYAIFHKYNNRLLS